MYKMMVEADDWNELQSTLADTAKTIENYRKILENLCVEFKLITNKLDSKAYNDAIKLI